MAAEVWSIPGLYAICPHANTAHMDGAAPYEKFIEADLDHLLRCDMILMLRGWEQSKGAQEEFGAAVDAGLPIFFEGWHGLNRLREWVDTLDDSAPGREDDVISVGPVS